LAETDKDDDPTLHSLSSTKRVKASRQRKSAKAATSSIGAALDTKQQSSKATNTETPTTDTVLYRGYAEGCRYETGRPGNFCNHWQRRCEAFRQV
jgi:hypothetical protein